jgi:Cu2+-exporting ATPase
LEHAVEAHDANVEYVVAHGICSSVDGEKIIIGSRHFVEEDEGVDVSGGLAEVDRLASQGKTVLYMAHGGRLMGLIGIADPLRPES